MKPRAVNQSPQEDLFRSRLEEIINLKHELVKLSQSIDWNYLDSKLSSFYSTEGRPAIQSRLMIGLHLLKYMHALSDESVCEQWVENPYFQYFCGEAYFQHQFPIERSSMTHFRKRVGEAFCVSLVQESLKTAFDLGALETKQLKRVVVDTTVQPKAVTFPTDAKLRYKAIIKLGQLCREKGVELRQSYVRVSKKAMVMSCLIWSSKSRQII